VLAAVRKLTGRDLQLVFMGDGDQRQLVEAAAKSAGLDGDVVFLGQQSNPFAVMRACQYGLMTSAREGFPNVVLEMMACGVKAIVMTPCAGDLETLTGVHVTKDFSSRALADALSTAINEGHDFSRTYRAVVAERSVERYVDAILGAGPPLIVGAQAT
jgi:glycosyltransferase involved in cell wall biosynthesis